MKTTSQTHMPKRKKKQTTETDSARLTKRQYLDEFQDCMNQAFKSMDPDELRRLAAAAEELHRIAEMAAERIESLRDKAREIEPHSALEPA